MVRTFEAEFGVPDAFRDISMGGRTDSWLLSQALAKWGIEDTPEHHARFRASYVPRLAEEIVHPGTGTKAVMPGVRELLDAARRPLASAPGAADRQLPRRGGHQAAPLRAVGLLPLRRVLGRLGRSQRPGADCPGAAPGSRACPTAACARVVVIGDTPHDITCAAVAGAMSVAVATGGHSRDELARAGADIALDDLSDTTSVLDAARRAVAPDDAVERRRAMIVDGSDRGPVALPVFKTGCCLLAGQAGFDSQTLPPLALRVALKRLGARRGRPRPAGVPDRARLPQTTLPPCAGVPEPGTAALPTRDGRHLPGAGRTCASRARRTRHLAALRALRDAGAPTAKRLRQPTARLPERPGLCFARGHRERFE